MALKFIPKLSAPSMFFVMVVLAMTTFPAIQATHEFKETHLSFYAHDFLSGPNITDVAFADLKSASVGRIQGMFMVSSLDGRNAYDMLSIVFTNKKYNGSTLQIQGIDKQFEQYRELSVVSGAGNFRFVQGYITYKTVFVDLPNAYFVTQCNVTVRHY
ncbi:dirigent protein 11-like [Pyrus ussuriensis x Pyrus communis]|uniref:Dirigent protein n=1 Tax=Pyrus ussuriensis x Pyrus communis TaxID=2448454 RepID=A0A5N5GDM7_9ROSA|nr:dirigent protein 11-like [Pyrus ussuriensis x Pyrus communis]